MPLDFLHAFQDSAEVTAFFTTRLSEGSPPPINGLNLGLTTKDQTSNVETNWKYVFKNYGWDFNQLRLPKLIHSEQIVSAENCSEILGKTEGDAIYTHSDQFVIAVTMADCLPVFIFDPKLKTVAAVHAGWKGTKLNILQKTLTHLEKIKCIDKNSVRLAFGPCIGKDVYELKTDTAQYFENDFLKKIGKDRFLFDLQGANIQQALKFGISEKNLEFQDRCTFTEGDKFFSYRRDNDKSGRMAAVIKLAKIA